MESNEDISGRFVVTSRGKEMSSGVVGMQKH